MPSSGKSNDVREAESIRCEGEIFRLLPQHPLFGVDRKAAEMGRRSIRSGSFFAAGLSRMDHEVPPFFRHIWSKREDVRPSEGKKRLPPEILCADSPIFTSGADVPSHLSHMRGA
jgi:hypothetical protein